MRLGFDIVKAMPTLQYNVPLYCVLHNSHGELKTLKLIKSSIKHIFLFGL